MPKHSPYRSPFFIPPQPPSGAVVHKGISALYGKYNGGADIPQEVVTSNGAAAACFSIDPDSWWTYPWSQVTCQKCLKLRPKKDSDIQELKNEIAALRKAVASAGRKRTRRKA